jgi:hypothetical protein
MSQKSSVLQPPKICLTGADAGLQAVEACASGLPIWALRPSRMTCGWRLIAVILNLKGVIRFFRGAALLSGAGMGRRGVLRCPKRPRDGVGLFMFISPLSGHDGPGGRARVFASDDEMSKTGEVIRHPANTANTAMPYLCHLRYLRRPAALKIVSSETFGSLASLSFALTRRHRFALGSVAWPGTPSGYSSFMMPRIALDLVGVVLSLSEFAGPSG